MDLLLCDAKRHQGLLDHLAYRLENGTEGERPGQLYLRRAQILRDELGEKGKPEAIKLQGWNQNTWRRWSLFDLVFDGAEYDTWSNNLVPTCSWMKYCEQMQLVEILGGQLIEAMKLEAMPSS